MKFKKILKKIKSFVKHNPIICGVIFFIIGGYIILSLVLQVVLQIVKNELSMGVGGWILLIILSICLIIILTKAIIEKKRRSMLTCDCCKQIYYEEDIDWIETQTQILNHKGPLDTKTTLITVVDVLFTCTCHNCQKVKKFTHQFTISKGNKIYNLEVLIDKYLDLDFRRKIEAKAEKEAQFQAEELERELIEEQKKLGIDKENVLKDKEEQIDFANETKKDE